MEEGPTTEEGGGYFMHGFGAVMDRCGGGTRKKVHMSPKNTNPKTHGSL